MYVCKGNWLRLQVCGTGIPWNSTNNKEIFHAGRWSDVNLVCVNKRSDVKFPEHRQTTSVNVHDAFTLMHLQCSFIHL